MILAAAPLLAAPLLVTLLTAGPAQAGSRWLVNDGYVDDSKVGFQGGFVAGECWGSVYVPDSDEYPFTLEKVRMLVGGSTGQELFTIEFFNITGTTLTGSNLLGAEGVYVQGSDTSWNEVDIDDLELGLSQITEGNVAVSVCLEEHSGYPAIARDTDGMAYPDRNYLYADAGAGWQWYPSNLFGLTGDWIMRLCIDGDGVDDEGCSDGGGGGGTGDGGGNDGGSVSGDLAIASITPDSVAEGEAVDIVVLGEGFSDSAEARIGGIALVGNDVVSDTTIQGRTPTTLPVGIHDVEVVDGDNSVYLAGAFEVTGGGCGCASGGRAGGAGVAGLLLGLVALWRRRD